MSFTQSIASTYDKVPLLSPLARVIREGRLGVSIKNLPAGMKAVYAPGKESVPGHPEVEDEIVLSDQEQWDDPGLWERSIMVHEGYHALDDLKGVPIPHLQSEATAWTGQAAYLIDELSQADEEAWGKLNQDLAVLTELERMSLAISTANVRCPKDLSPTRTRLQNGLLASIKSLTNVQSALAQPDIFLPRALWLIYGTSPDKLVPWDGIGKALD